MTRKRKTSGRKSSATGHLNPDRQQARIPPHLDSLIGERLRRRRVMQGLSQEQLARKLGVNFQQIQKYERGATQIGAARLYRLSDALDTPISYFFAPTGNEDEPGVAAGGDALHAQLSERRTIELIRAFGRIDDEEISRCIVELVRGMAGDLSRRKSRGQAVKRP
ncbi:MAG: helix-turn-helix transcriptional regulator [Rhodovibrionaceae bacterium]|nr:helix-turn-helix transcriptional regulator [Rhodovibrionaceae bacterium]